jgi:tetratricopeptide (TPR) repeat protein
MDTIQTINRILDFFPKEQQAQVRVQLAGALRAVISLRLIPRIDMSGRVPAVEVLLVTPTVRGYMEEGKLGAIKELIRDGGQSGMQTFDQSLIGLYKKGLISIDDAKKNATSPQEIDLMLKGITSSRASAQSILDNMLKEQGRHELTTEIKAAKDTAARGLIKEAFAMFEKLREKYPDDREVGENLESLRNRLSSEQFSQDIKNIIQEGLNIYKKGNIKGAIVKWQEGLSIDPASAQLKAYIKSAEEKLAAAENLPGIIAEGVAIYKTGKIEEAIEKWNEALRLDGSNAQARSYISGAEQKLRELKLKKETDSVLKSGMDEINAGNELEALMLFKRALNLKPDSAEIKNALDASYGRLAKENFGEDVDGALASEAFVKGINRMLDEDYLAALKEWKKVVEKRPLEHKLKDYMEKTKKILKNRLETLMENADESYRNKKTADTMDYLNKILHIDPANEFALKYMHDLKPIFDEEVSKLYREASDLYAAGRFRESKEKILMVLRIDPGQPAARKKLEEINERISAAG